jgi:uncharacterized protein (TIGR03000 family)
MRILCIRLSRSQEQPDQDADIVQVPLATASSLDGNAGAAIVPLPQEQAFDGFRPDQDRRIAMRWRFPSLLRPVAVVLALLSLWGSAAPTVRGHGGWGGHYGGWGWGGHWGGWGWHGPGFYRPYYGYGFGLGAFGLGLGLGYGLGYGLGGYGYYAPYYGGYGPYGPYYGYAPPIVYSAGSVAPNAGAGNSAGAPAASGYQSPPDNAAHLQLQVPEDAEVWFAGTKIERTGRIREFVSPPLPPGRAFNYRIVVRYTDATGKPVEDKRTIQVRANDWFSIDFTRPPPPNGKPPDVPPPPP